MINSELSDAVNFRTGDPHADKRRKWHTKNAGKLDLKHRAGEKTVFSEEKVYRQAKTPQWVLEKRARKKEKRAKVRKDKNAAIYHRQQAYRRAKQQYLKGEISGPDGEDVANLSWLDFHTSTTSPQPTAIANAPATATPGGKSPPISALLKLTSDEYVAAEMARKAGHSSAAKGDAEKFWEQEIDSGALEQGAVERAAGELVTGESKANAAAVNSAPTGDDGGGGGDDADDADPEGLHAALPELFNGFVHSKSISKFRSKDEVNAAKRKLKQDAKRTRRAEQERQNDSASSTPSPSPLQLLPTLSSSLREQHPEDHADQVKRVFREVETDAERMRRKEAEAAQVVEAHHALHVEQERKRVSEAERQRRVEQQELERETHLAKSPSASTAIPGGLTVLSFTEQRALRRKKVLQRSGGRGVTTFDLSLPGNMRVLKPDQYQVRYLSHCTVQEDSEHSAFSYHPLYDPPLQCCLGGGAVRHTYVTLPMLVRDADPTLHENNTWGAWSVARCTVIRTFVSREEAVEFAKVNKVNDVFPTEESVMAERKKRDAEEAPGVSGSLVNKAKMKRSRKKAVTGTAAEKKAAKKAAKRAAKKRAKNKAAAEAAKLAAEQSALNVRREKARLAELDAKARLQKSPPKVHALGRETERLWVEDECVVLLHNGRVLSHVHAKASCMPAGAFEAVHAIHDYFVVQIGCTNGKWSALDRDGAWHKFTVDRHGMPRREMKVLPLKGPWLERKRIEREAEAARLAAVEAARQATLAEEQRLIREAEEVAKKAKEDALWA